MSQKIVPIRVMAIKKSTLGAQFFQRPLNCRVVLGTPFSKNIWMPIFSKNLPGTDIMYHACFALRSPTFCHVFRVPGGVRHLSFVVIRQRVRAPDRSPCIITRQRVREPGRVPHKSPFSYFYQQPPATTPPAKMKQIARVAAKYHPLKNGYLAWIFVLALPPTLRLNPVRTGGVFHQAQGFFANNFGSNKGTQSKLGDFS